MAEIDWEAIRSEYIAGSATYQSLADKYGVSLRTIERHAAKEKWKSECRKSIAKVIAKTATKSAMKKADRTARANEIADRLMEEIMRIINLGEITMDDIDRAMRCVQRYTDILGIRQGVDAEKMRAEIERLQKDDEKQDLDIHVVLPEGIGELI